MHDLARLRLDGDLLTPGHPDYDTARRPVDPAHQETRPLAVARCRSAADVAAVLAYARDTGTPTAPRGGGHCFAGRSTTDGIVLDLAALDTVAVADGTATIGAGARLAQVYTALHARGRTLPAGCGATVGIAGLTLGGGIGLLGRVHGLTSDRLTGARVVLADGRIVDCDADREPDLFWGPARRWRRPVRGRRLARLRHRARAGRHPVRPALEAAAARGPGRRLAGVGPGRPRRDHRGPRARRGRRAVRRRAPGRGPHPRTAARLLRRGRGGTGGEVQGGMPFHRLKRSFEDLDDSVTAVPRSRSAFFSQPLQPSTIAALTASLTGGRRLNFTAMGGAYNRVPAAATAFAHRGERFMLQLVAPTADPWLDETWAIAHGDSSKRVYPNFPDPLLTDWATAYHGTNLDRLRAVKRAYDPDRRFSFPQSL